MAPIDDEWGEIYARFFHNSRREQRDDVVRLGFLIEDAHWYYCDIAREKNSALPNLKLREFFDFVFDKWPLLAKIKDNVQEAYDQFNEYKWSIPTAGCILVNSERDKVLMVKSFSKTWGFPRGKIDKDEELSDCAVRETVEETGYDCATKINAEDYIELKDGNDRVNRLFIIEDVPEDFAFSTQTKGEIMDIQWFRVADLVKADAKELKKKFFTSNAFFKPLEKRLQQRRSQRKVINEAVQKSAFASFELPTVANTSRAVHIEFPEAWKNINEQLTACVARQPVSGRSREVRFAFQSFIN
eukprot:TRINITY_DN10026_c0_g1_i2.p1 TRINITY_DN10026_c0_g1~~TRINITY_DN10026_c0_g1_i2.p1  ORF type:complete len:300 (+),score=59.79 TRINITY_DN10026_c0_g1_i2:55-954(+)